MFCGFSQELPPIQNYSAVTYGGANQNWSITQTKEKYIYVANNSGLLEFNGADWELYPSPNGSVIRSVKAVKEVVYTGCYMEFGLWEKNKKGSLDYHSLSQELQFPLIEDEQFWNIIAYKDWVLFQSLQRIYVYNTKDKTLNSIDSPSKRAQIFKVEDVVYFQQSNVGIFKIENGKAVLVSDDFIVKNKTVVGVFLKNEKLTFLVEDGMFYTLEDTIMKPWQTALNKAPIAINVYSSLQLADGSLVLGTISNGIYHLNTKGELINKINQQNGLNNNTVLSVFQDVDKNLWLALDNGISVINLDAPFQEYIDKIGKLGQVYAAKLHQDYLYLGTNQGLFYKKVGTQNDFNFIANTKGQVWCLREINGDLFCGHNNGTYRIYNNTASLVSNFPGTWDIKTVYNNPNILLQGNYQGLSILEKKGGSWGLRNKIEGFDIASRFYEWVEEDKIVVNHENKGIFVLQLDKDLRRVHTVTTQEPKGTGASLVTYRNQILYINNNGIFVFDTTRGKFVKNENLTTNFFKEKEPPIGVLIPDGKENRLWGFSNTNILSLSPSRLNDGYEMIEIPVSFSFRRNMGVFGFESITPLVKNKYLIGTANGYTTLNLEKLQTKEYQIQITGITKQSSGKTKEKLPLVPNQELPYTKNKMEFSYSVPEYDKYIEVVYQYQLVGMHKGWSNWSKNTTASFENLPYGAYTFKVRGSLNNIVTEVKTTSFEILRPWYFSYLAYFIYILIVGLLFLFVHKQYNRYYRKQQQDILKDNKRKLKRKEQKTQRKIIEITNEKLKEEIASKNRELAVSTMSIIKKNEFLNALKSQLAEAKSPPQIKAVIKTIDRNINNEDDWRVFEEAFNNADKDFLKKIKELHADLTPNDLRLCAYLRLNLSSKEIAPLLNISARSVEVKRYRLRKKMGLEHEKGLVDYILSI